MGSNQIVKTSLFTLILTFLTIGAIVFAKEVMKKEQPTVTGKTVTVETWYFTGQYNNDVTDPRNYSLDPLDGQPCVEPLETVCQIKAPKNPLNEAQPHMEAAAGSSSTVQQEIEAAVSSLSGPSPNPTTNSTVIAFRAE